MDIPDGARAAAIESDRIDASGLGDRVRCARANRTEHSAPRGFQKRPTRFAGELGNRHRLNAASRSHLVPATASISPDGAHVAVSRLNHDGGCVGNTSKDNGVGMCCVRARAIPAPRCVSTPMFERSVMEAERPVLRHPRKGARNGVAGR